MHFLQIACLLFAQELWRNAVTAEFSLTSSPSNVDVPDDEQLDLEAINGTNDYLSTITKDITGKPWDESRITRSLRLAKCEQLQNSTCFGAEIQYKFTSIQLSNESSQGNSLRKLNQLEASRFVPMCWAVIQPFLCAVYMPKCTRSKGREYVYLPSDEMCRVTSKPCRILYEYDFFPPNLQCSKQVFPCRNCTNEVREMKFNARGQCISPLVPTESPLNHYPDIEGCGLQCKNPMYTDDEHESVHALILCGTILCFICNLFVIATFIIQDWKHSKHPAWNLFYISICFLFNWIGWMLQFIPENREKIVCRRDGTLRHSEPSAGENLACVVSFILIHYFLIAANVWFAIFTYAWYSLTKDRGSVRNRIDTERFYFHLIAWALPFALTVSIMVLSEVDSSSMIGICFVGYRNRAIRNGLVMVPVAILSFGVSTFFAFKGGINLNRIKRATTNNDESKKLGTHILGMGVRTVLVVLLIFAIFIFDSYEGSNAEVWEKSLKDFIICKITESYSGSGSKCRMENRPSVAVIQLRLLCLFGVNLLITSWCWTWPALKTWKRFIKKKIGHKDGDEFTKPWRASSTSIEKLRLSNQMSWIWDLNLYYKHRLLNAAYPRRDYSANNLDASNDRNASLERKFEYMQQNDGRKLELLKGDCDRTTNGLNEGGSRKSQRYSQNGMHLQTKIDQKSPAIVLNDDVQDEVTLRKDNCDVGIQANDYDNFVPDSNFEHNNKNHSPNVLHLKDKHDEDYGKTDPLESSLQQEMPSIIPKGKLSGNHLSEPDQN